MCLPNSLSSHRSLGVRKAPLPEAGGFIRKYSTISIDEMSHNPCYHHSLTEDFFYSFAFYTIQREISFYVYRRGLSQGGKKTCGFLRTLFISSSSSSPWKRGTTGQNPNGASFFLCFEHDRGHISSSKHLLGIQYFRPPGTTGSIGKEGCGATRRQQKTHISQKRNTERVDGKL